MIKAVVDIYSRVFDYKNLIYTYQASNFIFLKLASLYVRNLMWATILLITMHPVVRRAQPINIDQNLCHYLSPFAMIITG